MADEADALEGAEVEESRQEGAEEQQQAPPTIEEIASEVGWKPQEQWKGDGWMPAADFLRAGREGRDSTKRELKAVRDQLERITRTSSQLLEDKLAERDAYWAEKQAQAVEEGDHAAVNKAVEERLKLKSAAPAQQPNLPSEAVEFQERHSGWFGKDPLATTRAKQIAEGLAKEGYDVPTQLREVERAIRKEFPEHFQPAPKPKDPPGTQTGGSRAANVGSKAKGFADMPPASQKMALDYERRHGVKKETFAASYWGDQANQRRA